MGAPKGNKNAEIWTEVKAIELFDKALELCKEKSYYAVHGVNIEGYSFDFIGEIACELDTFHTNITRDLPDRFPHLKTKVSKLVSYMERNCYSNTKKGIIKEATGIVNLKSNHKWTDRQQIDQNVSGNLSIDPKEWVKSKQ